MLRGMLREEQKLSFLLCAEGLESIFLRWEDDGYKQLCQPAVRESVGMFPSILKKVNGLLIGLTLTPLVRLRW